MDQVDLLRAARRAAGMSQAELAARAGTSQATLSAYERGVKSPALRVLCRLLAAADSELTLRTRIDWVEHHLAGMAAFWVPNRLWRVPTPTCFETVRMPDLLRHTEQDRWDLRELGDRRRFYEMLVREGEPTQMLRWLDGGFLVDLWSELDLPDAIRMAWQPAVRAAHPMGTKDSLAPVAGYGVEPLARLQGRTKARADATPPPTRPRRSVFDPRPPGPTDPR